MDQNERDRDPEDLGAGGGLGTGRDIGTDRTTDREDEEDALPTGTSGSDEDLQREGNLGHERNRNEPDSERLPGGDREGFNR